ncbi:MAG: hypothetical protein LKI78_05855 [Bifidobacterium tibiigranuli]|jgi:hypothetical protein|nr:hypothetical protein [Bifidobacterium tibiigranuli]
MQIGKMMLIEERIKRNLTPAQDDPLNYSLTFGLDNINDKPWSLQLNYLFKIDIGEGDEIETLCECSGVYAIDFENSGEEKTLLPDAYELAWPFLRADVITLLSSAKLFPDIPYSLSELPVSHEGATVVNPDGGIAERGV